MNAKVFKNFYKIKLTITDVGPLQIFALRTKNQLKFNYKKYYSNGQCYLLSCYCLQLLFN